MTFLGLHLTIGNSVLFLKKIAHFAHNNKSVFDFVKQVLFEIFWHAMFAYTTVNTLEFIANQYRYENYT